MPGTCRAGRPLDALAEGAGQRDWETPPSMCKPHHDAKTRRGRKAREDPSAPISRMFSVHAAPVAVVIGAGPAHGRLNQRGGALPGLLDSEVFVVQRRAHWIRPSDH